MSFSEYEKIKERHTGNGRDQNDDDLLAYTSVAAWLDRNIPDPDFLLGEVFSTTSRGLLVANTGLGKTNFAMAMAAAIAAGADFLHWRGRGRTACVLIVEGEMSRRLVKRRLRDMANRAGGIPLTLHVVSLSDPCFADMPPLNTEAGQRYLNDIIERLGGVDFIIFDNIQALMTGDMKDEEPWQQTLPWIRSLTNRDIGQLWVHHTGHDTTHAYGTKTREWQLDLVILLEEVTRPDADIAFKLKFTKARERAPANRADFAEVTITLAKDLWRVEGAVALNGKAKAPRQPSPLGQKFYQGLLNALASPNAPDGRAPGGRPAVTPARWKSECQRLGLLEGDNDNSDRALVSKYRKELIACNLVACQGKDLIWTLECPR